MGKTSSIFSISGFRCRVVAWFLLVMFVSSLLPSVSLAQQPMATIRTLSGTVLVSGQAVKVGTVLSAGDTIQTQAGASVVLALSDGSELQLGENTQVNLADLTQTVTGARVSRLKMMWGRIRAKLSPGHQQAGSSFDIETPNALVGVKFSQPDFEVGYDPAKQETIGIAHTVELIALMPLTGEKMIVPVGSTVIITNILMKIVAGTAASIIPSETGTAAATTATKIGTGTIIAIGMGAAAGGVAAVVASSEGKGKEETAESTGDLSGQWNFSGSCVAQGCTDNTPCMTTAPNLCGVSVCNICNPGPGTEIRVTQSGNNLAGICVGPLVNGNLNGVLNGNDVSFTTQPCGEGAPIGTNSHTSHYMGTLDGNTIQGRFQGSVSWDTPNGGIETATWSGTFTVHIEKE